MNNCIILNVTGKMIIDKQAREWCKLPYPDHPHGCPNYGKKKDCPPQAPFIESFISLSKPHFFVCQRFDLGSWSKQMKEKHPEWSDRQARCCLYWQGHVRKLLRESVKKNLRPGMIYTLCHEAMGVNVIKTAKRCGLSISVRPKDIVYKIALMGYPNNIKQKQLTLNSDNIPNPNKGGD